MAFPAECVRRVILGPIASANLRDGIAEILQHHAVPLDSSKQFGAALRFSFANSVSTEYYPLNYTARVLFPEPENCATATNFDVV